MGKLNQPREIPYDFKVFEWQGIAWLFDDSSRTYICSQIKNIWAEPLYYTDREDYEDLPDADYFVASMIEKLETLQVPLHSDDTEASVTEEDAWDSARDEANGNCLI